MRKLIFLLFAMIAGAATVYAQQEEYAKMQIVMAYEGNQDCTARYKDEQAYLTFYKTEANEFCMASVWPKSDVKSYGVVKFDFSESKEETATDYATMEYTFDWHYTNSVDGQSGVARCMLVKVYMPTEVLYVMTYDLPDGSNHLFRVGMDGDADEFFDDVSADMLSGLLGTWAATTLDVYDDGGEHMKAISLAKEDAEFKVTFTEDMNGVINTLNDGTTAVDEFCYFYDWPYVCVQPKNGPELIFKYEDGKLVFEEFDDIDIIISFEKLQ